VKEGKELSMYKRTAIRVEDPNQHVGMNWLREAAVTSAASLFITVWATLVSRVFTFSYTSNDASLMIGEVVFWTGVALTSVNVYLSLGLLHKLDTCHVKLDKRREAGVLHDRRRRRYRREVLSCTRVHSKEFIPSTESKAAGSKHSSWTSTLLGMAPT